MIANLDAVKAHPRFRRKLREFRVLLAVAFAFAVCAVVAGSFVAARNVTTASITPEIKNRDIVLCLDVSGSMAGLDASVLETFESLAGDFTGERIGLVLFDGSPLQVFPLTTDYDYVSKQLRLAAAGLGGGAYRAGTSVGGGISIIGDGVAGCLMQFDRLEQPRSRTVILGTDYRSASDPLISTTETTKIAVDRGITVHGLNPAHRSGRDASVAFEIDVAATGGLYFDTRTDAASAQAVEAIVAGVTSEAATVATEAPIKVVSDVPDAAIWLFCALALGLLLVVWRLRL